MIFYRRTHAPDFVKLREMNPDLANIAHELISTLPGFAPGSLTDKEVEILHLMGFSVVETQCPDTYTDAPADGKILRPGASQNGTT